MGLTTQDPYIQKERTKLYKILKFRVNCANIQYPCSAARVTKALGRTGKDI